MIFGELIQVHAYGSISLNNVDRKLFENATKPLKADRLTEEPLEVPEGTKTPSIPIYLFSPVYKSSVDIKTRIDPCRILHNFTRSKCVVEEQFEDPYPQNSEVRSKLPR